MSASAPALEGKGVLSASVSRPLDQLAKGGSRSAGLTHLMLVRTCAVKLPDKSIVNVKCKQIALISGKSVLVNILKHQHQVSASV